MSKTSEIQSEMIKALKSKDTDRKEVLSVVLSALKGKAKDKKSELTLDEENAIIKKEIKQTYETLNSAPKEREDIIKESEYKISVLKEFAPVEMSEDEIRNIVKDVLNELGLDEPSPKDKGVLMKNLMPKVKGKADGQLVNKIVQEILVG